MNRGGFSWRRFLGVSAAQSRLSRAIGIPLSRSGRRQKLGRMLMGGGRRGSGGGSGCSGCMLIIFVVLCTGWKGCSAIFSPATNSPAYSSSTASGQTPVAGPASGQAQVPEKTDTPKADTPKADDASEGQSPASRDSFKTKEPAPDPLLLKSLEGLQLPTTVTSIAPLSLLEPGGKPPFHLASGGIHWWRYSQVKRRAFAAGSGGALSIVRTTPTLPSLANWAMAMGCKPTPRVTGALPSF